MDMNVHDYIFLHWVWLAWELSFHRNFIAIQRRTPAQQARKLSHSVKHTVSAVSGKWERAKQFDFLFIVRLAIFLTQHTHTYHCSLFAFNVSHCQLAKRTSFAVPDGYCGKFNWAYLDHVDGMCCLITNKKRRENAKNLILFHFIQFIISLLTHIHSHAKVIRQIMTARHRRPKR